MAKLSQLISVKVGEKGEEGGRRKLTIEIGAAAPLFLLSDTLAQEGALKTLEASLRAATKDAIVAYISAGREFIKSAAIRKELEKGGI